MCLRCTGLESQIASLTEKIEVLQQKLADLGAGIIPLSPLTFLLTPTQLKIVVFLARARAIRSKEAINSAIYDNPYSDPALTNTITVLISQANRRLRPVGVQIESLHGHGYFISPEGAKRINEILHAEDFRQVARQACSWGMPERQEAR